MSDFYMFVASCLLCVAGFVTFTLYEDCKYKKRLKIEGDDGENH